LRTGRCRRQRRPATSLDGQSVPLDQSRLESTAASARAAACLQPAMCVPLCTRLRPSLICVVSVRSQILPVGFKPNPTVRGHGQAGFYVGLRNSLAIEGGTSAYGAEPPRMRHQATGGGPLNLTRLRPSSTNFWPIVSGLCLPSRWYHRCTQRTIPSIAIDATLASLTWKTPSSMPS
jgi:hypothetical protein